MMGQQSYGQNELFYDFCIEQQIPHDHLLKQIDQVLNLSDLRQYLIYSFDYCRRTPVNLSVPCQQYKPGQTTYFVDGCNGQQVDLFSYFLSVRFLKIRRFLASEILPGYTQTDH